MEFNLLMGRSGVAVPPDWHAGVLAGYLELRSAAELLRGALPPELEPCNIYDPLRVMR
jgi:hypothetical protein